VEEDFDLKFEVFRDLSINKKLFVTDGSKFGADFLAYKGDPLIFHSEYLIKCIENC